MREDTNMHHEGFQLTGREVLIAFFLSMVAALAFVFPLFLSVRNWGIQDWDQHLFIHEVPLLTVSRYHQVPLWNPYYLGGTVMLALPESRIATPFFLLYFVFGTVVAIKIEILLHTGLGLLGTYFLSRESGLGRLPASLPPALYVLSSMFALSLTAGMSWFLAVAYLPWVFFCLLRAGRKLTWIWGAAACLALMFTEGGAYPFSITCLFLLLYSILLIPSIGLRKAFIRLTMLLVLAVCLGAVKFLPAAEFMRAHPRYVQDYSGYSVESLTYSLFGLDQTLEAASRFTDEPGFWRGMSYGMDENGMYVGILGGLLFLVGILQHRRSGWRLQSLPFFVFLWLAFGNRALLSLWSLLHILPVYNFMRVAQRFRIIMMLFFAIIAGFGLQEVRRFFAAKLGNDKRASSAIAILLALVYINLYWVNTPVWRDAFPIPPQKTEKQANFQQIPGFPMYDASGYTDLKQTRGAWSGMYPALLSNFGSIDAYSLLNVPKAAIPINSPDYRGEVYLRDTSGFVKFTAWSPNRLRISVQAARDGFLVVNQNYYPGWHCSDGREVANIDGQFGVSITPSDREIELYYLPTSFILGACLSSLTFFGGIITLIWSRICEKRRYMATS